MPTEVLKGSSPRPSRDRGIRCTWSRKWLQTNASYDGTIRAAEQSLRRLNTDVVDLYLLHWQGSHPLEETLRAFLELQKQGKIRSYGVSNFDTDDIHDASRLPGGTGIAMNQVLYNLSRRGAEVRLIPEAAERNMGIMAYSPLEQARLQVGSQLQQVAERHGVTWSEVALAWTLRVSHVVTIPKATNPDHVRRNFAAAALELSAQDLALLDQAYPPPTRETPLETL